MINKVKNIARLNGADEEVVENVYNAMIESFIKAEIKEFESLKWK